MKRFNIFDLPLDQNILIEASAGTGKTFNISSLIIRLLLEKDYKLKNILIVTFTNEAVQDLYQKIQLRIKKAIDFLEKKYDACDDDFIREYFKKREDKSQIDILTLNEAYYSIDEAPIFTIHSFCNKILSEFTFECRINPQFTILSDDSQLKNLVIKDCIRYFFYQDKNSLQNKWNDYIKISSIYNIVKKGYELDLASLKDLTTKEFLENLFSYLKYNIDRIKNRENSIFFDDLILLVKKALENGNDQFKNLIRERYKVAIIDEFQDTDFYQYEIFKDIYKKNQLFLIGDPKQAIYSFRGADIYAYLLAKKDISNEHKYTLNTNWRSQPKLLQAINHLFNKENPFLMQEVQYINTESYKKDIKDEVIINNQAIKPIQLIYISRNSYNTSRRKNDFHMKKTWIEDHIPDLFSRIVVNLLNLGKEKKALIDNKPITSKDIAILVRNHKQAKIMQNCLKKYNISSLLLSKESVFSTNEALNLLYLLYAIVDFSDKTNIYNALITDIFDFSLSEIYDILNNETKYQQFVEKLSELNQIWTKKGFLLMFYKFLFNFNITQKLLRKENGDRILTNLIQLAEIIAKKYQELKNQRALLRWLSIKIENKIFDSEEEILQLENDEASVKILTIHKSKGLEFPIVLIPFSLITDYKDIEDDSIISIHDEENYKLKHYIIENEETIQKNLSQYLKEYLSEEIRLFYVAVTRAKYLCYMSYGITSKELNSVLDYLLLTDEIKNEIKNSCTDSKLLEYLKTRFSNDVIEILDYKDILQNNVIKLSTYDKNEYQDLSFKKFQDKITQSFLITSYSELSEYDKEDRVYKSNKSPNSLTFQNEIPNKNSFPFLGAEFGQIFHEIIENISFNISQSELNEKITNILKNKQFDTTLIDYLKKLVWTSINLIIDEKSNLKLSLIDDSKRISEFEFYLYYNHPSLIEYVTKLNLKEKIDKILKENLSLERVDVYIHGFIDLFFKFNDKYYIIDFKTNYLGENKEDYRIDKLNEVMKKNYYDLQLLIYALAIDKYLQTIDRNYNYNTHFGGAYFLFVRGLSQDNNYGIYYSKPSIL